MKSVNRRVMTGIALLGWLTAACGAAAESTPQLVASFPITSSGGNSSAAVPDGPVVLETVYLALEVNDPDEAAGKAARLAYGYGGYETSRYAWYVDGGKAVSQEIFVPLELSDDFRARLLGMGWKTDESRVRHAGNPYGSDDGWAQFSIQFMPARPDIEWVQPLAAPILQGICGFVLGAVAFLVKAAASLLLAAIVVVPIVMMMVGAVTSVRWLIRK